MSSAVATRPTWPATPTRYDARTHQHFTGHFWLHCSRLPAALRRTNRQTIKSRLPPLPPQRSRPRRRQSPRNRRRHSGATRSSVPCTTRSSRPTEPGWPRRSVRTGAMGTFACGRRKATVTFSIERGQNPRISRDSRWVSALQKPPLEDSKTAKPKKKRAGQTLVLLDTQDGSRRTFDFVLSYDVTYSSSWLIYLQSPETKADEEEPSKDKATKPAAKPAAKERKVGTLHMVHLESDSGGVSEGFEIQNVAQHATHQTTDHFAYVLHDEETGRDTLHIARLAQWGLGRPRVVQRREDRRSVLGARSYHARVPRQHGDNRQRREAAREQRALHVGTGPIPQWRKRDHRHPGGPGGGGIHAGGHPSVTP